MNSMARFLAVYLALIFLDAATGFGVYKRLVHAASGAYCAVTNRSEFERYACTNRVFYSRELWMALSMGVGIAAGYVGLQAMRTRRW